MNRKLHDILAYICSHTQSNSDLSKARITKLVYLADWLSAYETGQPMTNIRWVFNHYGPYVNDVVEFAQNDPDFGVLSTYNAYGSLKEQVELTNPFAQWLSISSEDQRRLQHILDETSSMYFGEFIDYVYATYPVRNSNKYDVLDLPRLAELAKQQHVAPPPPPPISFL